MIATTLPLAGDKVDGRVVRGEVPNAGSISSSLGRYKILEGIREVSMDYFSYNPPYSPKEFSRVEELRDQIIQSQEISPLIVVEDAEGLYVLEGGHRLDALFMMSAASFPAMVVLDLDSLSM